MNNLVGSCPSLAEMCSNRCPSRNSGFRKRPYGATCCLLCCLCLLDIQRRLRFWISFSRSFCSFSSSEIWSALQFTGCNYQYGKVPRFSPMKRVCLSLRKGFLVKRGWSILFLFIIMKNKYDNTNSKVLLPIWISPSLRFCPLGEVSGQLRLSCLLPLWLNSI